MTYVVVTGSREWALPEPVKEILSTLEPDTIVIHGAARGLDTIAHNVCLELKLQVVPIFPDWQRYGKTAGVIRNGCMLDFQPKVVIGFVIDNIPCAVTHHCLAAAKQKGIPTIVCHTLYKKTTYAWE